MRLRILLPCALALALFAGAARATVKSDPVAVRLTGPRPVAEAGATLRAAFELRAVKTVVVENLRIEGTGWSGRLLAGAPSLAVTPAGPARIQVECTTANPSAPLVVAYEVAGVTWRHPFDLSPEAAAARKGRAVRILEAPPPPRRQLAAGLARVAAPTPAEPATDEAGRARAARDVRDPAATSRVVTVRGTFVYTRTDNTVIGADGITVGLFDWEQGLPTVLGVTVTDAWGYFEFSVDWADAADPDPDLYLRFEAANGWVSVCPEGDDDAYAWVTPPRMDYTGSELNFFGTSPDDEAQFPSLHLLTNLVRDRRWYESNGILTLPFLRSRWPAAGSGVSHYDGNSNEVHILAGAQWSEVTHGHEYGHAFFHYLGTAMPPEYCDAPYYCDILPPFDCGHCSWCPENTFVQWSEGGPNWLAVLQTETYGPIYGTPAYDGGSYESINRCIDVGFMQHPYDFADPLTTEGFASALLYDICDSVNEHDFNAGANGTDELTVAPNILLDAIIQFHPVSLGMFVGIFTAQHPELREQIWATAMNNRIDYDVYMPGEVGNLHSTSHTIGVPSPDDTPTFVWDRAPDDFSGVGGYCMSLTHAAGSPGFDQNLPDTTKITVASLEPGEWYVNLRAVDRSGHWSSDWQSAGPFVIRERAPSDLEPWTPTGWAGPLVPRPAADATTGSAPYPTAPLPGNAASTWWNSAGWNSGEAGVTAGIWDRLYLDGEPVDSVYFAYIAGGAHTYDLNHGPLTIRGGRHTLAMVHDDDGAEMEADESNNLVGRQWIWTPATLPQLPLQHRPAPPHPQGGYFQVTSGLPIYFNCDGLRMDLAAHAANWQLAFVRPDSANGNLVVELFAATTSPVTGFDTPLATSNRGNGCVNAVLVHKRNVGSTMLWDVGVARNNSVRSGYLTRKVLSTSLGVGDSLRQAFADGYDLRLFDYAPAAGATGWHTVRIRKISGPGTVHAAWFDDGFQAGSLNDRDEYEAVSDTNEIGFLDVNVTSTGSGYGIAVWRDMKDGTDPVVVEIELELTAPDFEPWLSDIFYSPLVPSPEATNPLDSVLVPASLPGNTASTYLNMVVRNNSNGHDLVGPFAHVDVDGGLAFWVKVDPLVTHVNYPFRIPVPITVRGGRHTLTVEWDRFDAIGERDEGNNFFGEQWVWSPLLVEPGTPLTRSSPRERTDGWDQVTSVPFGLFYNCDGLRTPKLIPVGHEGYWVGAAVMPGDTSNVDVRLHAARSGTQEGFRTNLGFSGWGEGRLDFCLANFNQTLPRSFDVGVLRASGAQPYAYEHVVSNYLGANPNRTFGPYDLDAGHLLRLHEVYLDEGRWIVQLAQGSHSGNVDWGLSVHPASAAYPTKSVVLEDGSASLAGPGAGEGVTVEAPEDGYYCIAVWKAGSSDVPVSGLYTLRIERSLLDAPGTSVPARTALGVAYPNPTGLASRIGFDLARASHASVIVYDLRGARVRTLCDREFPAGRHELAWEGEDDRGRAVAPGVYLVRFRADGVEGVRRVVRLE